MKKLLLLLMFLTAPLHATTYFLAPASSGGNDSNSGTSSAMPWLSPNHAVNCGDVIVAAASASYSAANFGPGKWGNVTCPAGNNVAWLECAAFDACKIISSTTAYAPAMQITSSYWGVQGWEATTASSGGASYNFCFGLSPNIGGGVIHHIIFANDVANGCVADGFMAANNGNGGDKTDSFDYIAFVGNIAFNAAQQTLGCASGISTYQPINYDSKPGTHIYIAGNFSWANVDPSPCAHGTPSDGEGIIIDTPDGSQGGLAATYSGQIVVTNNMLIGNGGRGFEIYNNKSGAGPFALVYVSYNTVWGNNTATNQNGIYCGEILANSTQNTQAQFNIAATNASTGCGSHPLYAFYTGDSGSSSNIVKNNFLYSANGLNEGSGNSSGFSYDSTNITGVSPVFSNASVPGAPNCGSSSNVPNCMATTIAGFVPTASAAKPYGYQPVGFGLVVDPLFPQWLCNVSLPAGLVTMACQNVARPQPPTGLKATID